MRRILLVEDEPGLVLTLTDRLQNEGYEVAVAGDGVAGLDLASQGGFDALILDVMLPRKGGFDVCRQLRQTGNDVPILMLTARGELVDKVVGLQIGADDYLTKPFEMMELLARLEALLRRSGSRPQDGRAAALLLGPVRVDFRKGEVSREGQPVNLSAREFQLLHYFAERRGVLISRDELLEQVWGYQPGISTRTVDVHVAWLRQKLEENPKNPRYLVTVRGLGYKLAD